MELLLMAISAVTKMFPPCVVWTAYAVPPMILAATQGWDAGAIAAGIILIGSAVIGWWVDFQRKSRNVKLEADKLEAEAHVTAIKLKAAAEAEAVLVTARAAAEREQIELDARLAREKLALDAQIISDKHREKEYAGTMTEQLSKLQKAVDDGNRRTEDANTKLHDLKNEASAAALAFHMERQDLTKQLDELRHDYADLLMAMEGNIRKNEVAIKQHDRVLTEIKSGSADNIQVPAALRANTEATRANTEAIKEGGPA